MSPASPSALPTIRSRFFRALILTGSAMAIITSLMVGIVDTLAARQVMIDNLVNFSSAMANVAGYNLDDAKALEHDLRDFSDLPGLVRTCIYSAEGDLLAAWQRPELADKCPSIINEAGVKRHFFTLTIARQILDYDSTYLGMIYIEGALSEMKFFLGRIGVMTLLLLAVAVGCCMYIAGRTAKRISQPLQNLAEQVKCLQLGTVQLCEISPSDVTEETARLFRAVGQLRDQLLSSMISRQEAEGMRRWQEGRLNGLLTLLRSRLPEDSNLLPCIADHAMLLQLDSTQMRHDIMQFDLQEVADRTMASARKMQPPGPNVHVTLSMKASMPKQWRGNPVMVEALLRHLLLISLRRTHSGLTCLRLEAGARPDRPEDSILYFHLEDTGAEVQPLQIERLLKEAREGLSAMPEPLDLSWLVVGRIVEALQGDIDVVSVSGKGLTIQGWIPLQLAAVQSPLPRQKTANICAMARPLVMIVEDDRVNRQMQQVMLERLECDVFTVEHGAQALEWAPLLPFSLIILDHMLPDMPGTAVAAKLHSMMQNRLMPEVPLVALSAADTPQMREAWNNQVSRLLIKPLGDNEARNLRRDMGCPDASFYDYTNIEVDRQISAAIRAKLPELQRQLSEQLVEFCDLLATVRLPSPELVQRAHAVKSAALTLGYERLAGCLNVIEIHAGTKDASFEQNVAVILISLRQCTQLGSSPLASAS